MSTRNLTATDPESARAATPDIVVHGPPDLWVCVGKASSQKGGWMKTTKVLRLEFCFLVQTETQQRNPDGSWSLSQAIVHVPYTEARREFPWVTFPPLREERPESKEDLGGLPDPASDPAPATGHRTLAELADAHYAGEEVER